MMKNVFYLNLKALFIVEIFTRTNDFLVMWKNDLIKKLWSSSKFMTPQNGQQIIIIQILANISSNKDNQRMKLGQLIEYNMKNIFLQKSYTKYRDASPRPFSKKSKLISLDQQSEVF